MVGGFPPPTLNKLIINLKKYFYDNRIRNTVFDAKL